MFDILLKSNTINFLIVLGMAIYFIYKFDIMSKIEQVRREIKDYIETAKQEEKAKSNIYYKISDEYNNLPVTIEKIKSDTRGNVENLKRKIEKEIEEQKNDIKINAHRLLNLETKKFQSKLISAITEKSVDIARENAENQLKDNKELHNIYIDEAINELDRVQL